MTGIGVKIAVSHSAGSHRRKLVRALAPDSMSRFHYKVGAYLGSQLHDRLLAQVSPVQLRAPGLRQALARPDSAPGGVFRSNQYRVSVGSNLRHARHVHEGGTITPVTGKALAIPLHVKLKREALWPRDIDPERDTLVFLPSAAKFGVLGVLIDPDNILGYGKEPLYAIVSQVTHEPRPYAYIDSEDKTTIRAMWKAHVALESTS